METQLSILMLSPQYHPIVGGYERAAERLSRELARRGHLVTVVAERRRSDWPNREVRHGVQIVRYWCVFRAGLHMSSSLLSLVWTLLTVGRRHQIWHAHVFGPHALVMIATAWVTGRASILKLQSSGSGGIVATATAPGGGWQRSLLARASALVTLTRETTAEAEAVGVERSRIYELGNGVDMDQFRPPGSRAAAKAELGLEQNPFVLYVGRLSPEKNPEGLVVAWRKARNSALPEWRLILVGDGPLRETLAAKIELEDLVGNVLLVGQRSDVQRWMAAADVYVLPSEREGLSNALLESMASSLPVVATRVSGVTEVVEKPGAGVVVEVGDMSALSDALVRVCKDDDIRVEMGEKARNKIEQSYSISAVTSSYIKMYREVLSRSDKDAFTRRVSKIISFRKRSVGL